MCSASVMACLFFGVIFGHSLGGQVGLGHDQVHLRQRHRVVLGLNNSPCFGFIPRPQTFLLAGGLVFAAEHRTVLEYCESVLHSCLFGRYTN